MKLIGMLDSPYVRRVAISLLALELPFEHASISVFGGYAQFQQINPVVKAPTLACDDGTVLMESGLILDYAQALAGRSLLPPDLDGLRRELRQVGLALAAMEKSVQLVYEHRLRPQEKLHAPWVERVQAQLLAAYDQLHADLPALRPQALGQAAISSAVAWHFSQQLVPGHVPADRYPGLVALSVAAEALPQFAAAPHGDGEVTV